MVHFVYDGTRVVIFIFCAWTWASADAQSVFYVDADAGGANDGSSWADAFIELQSALAVAVPDDEIRVAQGTYKPDYDVGTGQHTGDRAATFQLLDGVTLEGGYAGWGEADPDARDVQAYETILSGDLDGDDGPDFANHDENSHHVVTGSGTDATGVLDGFTVTAGNSEHPTSSNCCDPHPWPGCDDPPCESAVCSSDLSCCEYEWNIQCAELASWLCEACALIGEGAGMYNEDGDPTVVNCNFRDNASPKGGGVYNSGGSPTFTNCTFGGNWAIDGGGVYNTGGSPTLTDCTFSGNSADHYGGGMANHYSSPTVLNCTFSGNSATKGSIGRGGGMHNYHSSPTLGDCMFSGNFADGSGGGIYNFHNNPTVTNCTFSENLAVDHGGGMLNHYSGPKVLACTFSANSADDGGGMANYDCSPKVTNCTFSGNAADYAGGGMYNGRGSTIVANCTFVGNTAYKGGGIGNSYDSSPMMANCILWDNSPNQVDPHSSTPTISYSNIEGGWPGEGNIDVDPMMVDRNSGNLRLLSGSPCIDAGDNNAVPEGTDTDRDGHPRFVDDPCADDTGNGPVPLVDMGAYEHQVPPECGNGGCEDEESCENCACDCGACCGDGICAAHESCASCPQDCECRILYVPGEYDTIQGAVDTAEDGEEIIVAPGVYHEAINLLGKAVVLQSSDGPAVTMIDASGSEASAVACMSGEGPSTVLEGFTLTGGYASYGGGMHNHYSSPTVVNCMFNGNSAIGGYDARGGGMYNHCSNPVVVDCTFSANSAFEGGGMYNKHSSPTVTNCTFSDNVANYVGSGMYNYRSTPTVTNCTFSENSALGHGGGGMFNWNSSPTMTNCILWGNVPNQVDGYNSTPTISYSDVQGGWPGDGNIDDDPLFVPGPVGCLYLSQMTVGQAFDSPCLDAGSETAESLELDTMTTRSDEGTDTGIVDMGYHYPVTGLPLIMGDYNRDGDVDLADFAEFQTCFSGAGPRYVPPCCRVFDFEPDEDVDLTDYDEFVEAFGP